MLPKIYSDYFEPFPKGITNPEPFESMPCNNSIRQKPIQIQQQPTNSSPNPMQMVTSPTDLGVLYTQGYLMTQIGKRMLITFLLGTNIIQDRRGTLEKVGISYIIIRDEDATTSTLCDIYSIKFVVIYP